MFLFSVMRSITWESYDWVLFYVRWHWIPLYNLAQLSSIACSSVTSANRPLFLRYGTALSRKLLACIFWKPQYTLYDAVSSGSIKPHSHFLISFMTSLYIFIMDSVELTPKPTVVVSTYVCLLHPNWFRNTFIWVVLYILAKRIKKKLEWSYIMLD